MCPTSLCCCALTRCRTTDVSVPRRHGPKRASNIRKLFNLSKEDGTGTACCIVGRALLTCGAHRCPQVRYSPHNQGQEGRQEGQDPPPQDPAPRHPTASPAQARRVCAPTMPVSCMTDVCLLCAGLPPRRTAESRLRRLPPHTPSCSLSAPRHRRPSATRHTRSAACPRPPRTPRMPSSNAATHRVHLSVCVRAV